MNDHQDTVSFTLPAWVSKCVSGYRPSSNITERMKFVVAASRQNVLEETGGPFAAAVFESESGRLVSLGVNLVTRENLSLLHAETVALTLAQSQLKTYDLSGAGLVAHDLVTSAEPCTMCFGATLWSGVRRIIIGARRADVRAVGFDEGPSIDKWQDEMKIRGIEAICDIERQSAAQVLLDYAKRGGAIYNSRAAKTAD